MTPPTGMEADTEGTGPYTRIAIGDDQNRREAIASTNRNLALVIAAVCALVMAYATWEYMEVRADAYHQAERRIETFNDLRHDAMETYFVTHENEVKVFAENPAIQADVAELIADWEAMDAAEKLRVREYLVRDAAIPAPSVAEATYLAHYARVQPELLEFIEHHGFYDLFMFTPGGELAFTVVAEDDFGLAYGAPDASRYADTGLGQAARGAAAMRGKIKGENVPIAMTDFEPYAPSNDDPAAFMAEPLVTEDGTYLGVLAVQLPFDRFNEIMDYSSGLKDTGRTLLVGSDRMIRNKLEGLGPDAHADLDTRPVEAALAGERYLGRATGERDQAVVAASSPLDYRDIRWAVMTEMDVEEIRAPLRIYLWVWLLSLLGTAVTGYAIYQILRARASD